VKNPDLFERHLFELINSYGQVKFLLENEASEQELDDAISDVKWLVDGLPKVLEGKTTITSPEHRATYNKETREDLMNSIINCIRTLDPAKAEGVYEDAPGQPDDGLDEGYFEKHDKGVVTEDDIRKN
jgi:hypothetical protein